MMCYVPACKIAENIIWIRKALDRGKFAMVKFMALRRSYLQLHISMGIYVQIITINRVGIVRLSIWIVGKSVL